MAYAVVVFLHSWLRWLVVAALAARVAVAARARARRRPWTALDRRCALAVVVLVDVQAALGVLLYAFLSPTTRAAFHDLAATMKDDTLRFFAIEHVFSVALALGAVHVAHARVRRAVDDDARHRVALVGAAGALLCVLVAIPWPFMPYARALFRVP